MAPKRPNPKEDPPAPSSSEEEDDEGNSSTDDDDQASSDDELPPTKRTLAPHSQGQPKKPATDSESEDDSGTDSDTDPPPKSPAVLHNVKPIASKPKPCVHAAPASSSKSTAAAAKRGSETEREAKDAKRRKESAAGEEDEGKSEDAPSRVLFQRLWGESDEIAVLNGLIEFAEKKGADPLKDMAGFYEFIKSSLAVDVSLSQLKEKVTRLRKKFKNHAKGKNGLDKSFSKAHDQKSFDLSKKIWDSQGEGLLGRTTDGKSNGKPKKSGVNNGGSSSKSAVKAADVGAGNGDRNAKSNVGGSNGGNANRNASNADLGAGNGGEDGMEIVGVEDQKGGFSVDWGLTGDRVGDFVVKKGLRMVEGSKRSEFDRRWKELNREALKLFVKRSQLITDQAQSMLDNMGS